MDIQNKNEEILKECTFKPKVNKLNSLKGSLTLPNHLVINKSNRKNTNKFIDDSNLKKKIEIEQRKTFSKNATKKMKLNKSEKNHIQKNLKSSLYKSNKSFQVIKKANQKEENQREEVNKSESISKIFLQINKNNSKKTDNLNNNNFKALNSLKIKEDKHFQDFKPAFNNNFESIALSPPSVNESLANSERNRLLIKLNLNIRDGLMETVNIYCNSNIKEIVQNISEKYHISDQKSNILYSYILKEINKNE